MGELFDAWSRNPSVGGTALLALFGFGGLASHLLRWLFVRKAASDEALAQTNALTSQAIAKTYAETLQSVVQSAMHGLTTSGGQPFMAMVERELTGVHQHLRLLNGRVGGLELEGQRHGWKIKPVYGTDAELGETGAENG